MEILKFNHVLKESCDIHIIRTTDDFINIYKQKVDKPTFYIVGKETFKLDSKKFLLFLIKRLNFFLMMK